MKRGRGGEEEGRRKGREREEKREKKERKGRGRDGERWDLLALSKCLDWLLAMAEDGNQEITRDSPHREQRQLLEHQQEPESGSCAKTETQALQL